MSCPRACYLLPSGMKNTISKTAVIVVVILVTATGTLWSQDEDDEVFVPTYSLGDQTLSINLGLFIPLFFALGPDGVAPSNLTLGGVGSLAWSSYLNNDFTVGLEVGGSFALTPNRRTLFMLPIIARGSYILSAYPFEFPLTIGLGMNFSRLDDMLKLDPFAKLGASFLWNHSSQWAFGLNLSYWLVPQLYAASSPAGSDASRLGNFLELTLSALYHF
jgi:hypothetical protein